MKIEGTVIEGDLVIPKEVDPEDVEVIGCYVTGDIVYE